MPLTLRIQIWNLTTLGFKIYTSLGNWAAAFRIRGACLEAGRRLAPTITPLSQQAVTTEMIRRR